MYLPRDQVYICPLLLLTARVHSTSDTLVIVTHPVPPVVIIKFIYPIRCHINLKHSSDTCHLISNMDAPNPVLNTSTSMQGQHLPLELWICIMRHSFTSNKITWVDPTHYEWASSYRRFFTTRCLATQTEWPTQLLVSVLSSLILIPRHQHFWGILSV